MEQSRRKKRKKRKKGKWKDRKGSGKAREWIIKTENRCPLMLT